MEHISPTFHLPSLPDVWQFLKIKYYLDVAAQLIISSTSATFNFNTIPNFPFYYFFPLTTDE
jgi:hypothetical protein